MRFSLRTRRFGLLIELLLLIGLLAIVGLGGVVLTHSLQTSSATGAVAEAKLLQETAAPSGVIPSPSPQPNPSVSQPQPSPSALQPADPYHVRSCGRPIDDINVLTDYASTIIRGTVKQVQPVRWSTPDGRRPPNPHAPDSMDVIYRPVIVQVDQYLKGEQPQRTLLIVARGGTVGQDTLDFCGDTTFSFTEGEQVVLFLTHADPSARPTPRETPGGPPFFDVATHFTITPDGQATSFAQQLPVQQLLDQIQAAQRP